MLSELSIFFGVSALIHFIQSRMLLRKIHKSKGLNVYYLKKFRARFSINFHGLEITKYILVDHKLKLVNHFFTHEQAFGECVYRFTGFYTWHRWYKRKDRRKANIEYYKNEIDNSWFTDR